MKRINFIYFLLFVLFSWLLTFNQSAFAGKANGESCGYEDDNECNSGVCYNATCVECASDTDCTGGMSCVSNSCQ